MANSMQSYKDWIKEIYDASALHYGEKGNSFFNYFAERLIEQSSIASGNKVLDVACGKGAILFPAAQAVGPKGEIVGIDLSSQMINQTLKKIKHNQLDWVKVKQMDAENLSFLDSIFDIVFCGFALFFFPNKNKAINEFKRILKPNGDLAVSIWGKSNSLLNPWVKEQAKEMGAKKIISIKSLNDKEALYKLLKNANLSDIKIVEESKTFYHETPQAWWESLFSRGARAEIEQLSQSNLKILKKKAIEKAKAILEDKGVPERRSCIYAFAKNSK